MPSLAWDPEWGQEASKRAQALLLSLRFHGAPWAVGDRWFGWVSRAEGSWPRSADGLPDGQLEAMTSGALRSWGGLGPIGPGEEARLLSILPA